MKHSIPALKNYVLFFLLIFIFQIRTFAVCHTEFTYVASNTNPDSVTFTPHGSAAVSYLWTFGDGSSSTASNPSHVYAQPGIYHVCLIIVDANGDSCDYCHNVEVQPHQNNCHVEFTYVASSLNPDSIIFTPHGSAAISYYWTFGDGNSSTASNPSHVYLSGGSHQVCLVIVDVNGDTCDYCHSLSTSPQAIANNSVLVMSNPTAGRIVFRLQTVSGNTTLNIFNSFGQIVYTRNSISNGDLEISGNDFSEGVYFFSITADGFEESGKMLIVH